MAAADQILNEIAQRRSGVIVRAEANAAGVSTRQLRRRAQVGFLERISSDVYLHKGVPSSHRQRLFLAVLSTGGVLSHRTAAREYEIIDHGPRLPEVTVLADRCPPVHLATVHRLLVLDDIDVTTRGGLPITTPVRTFIDIGTKVDGGVLVRGYERAIDADLFTFDELVAKRFDLARRGRDGVGVIHDLLAGIDPDLRATESDLETLLWEELRTRGVRLPVRQYEVRVRGTLYRLDFAYPDLKVLLEGDGFGVHRMHRVFERDRRRQNDLVLDGWLVLRTTWQMLVKRPGEAARNVSVAIERRQAGEI